MIDLLLTPHIGLIFWQTLALLLALFLLRRLAWEPILSFMEAQEEENRKASTQAAEAQKKLERTLARRDKVLQEVEAKKDRILQRAEATKEALIAEASLEAEQVRQEMVQKARLEMDKERQASLYAFKAEAGTLVIKTAQKLLQEELKKEQVKQLVVTNMIDESLKEMKKEPFVVQ